MTSDDAEFGLSEHKTWNELYAENRDLERTNAHYEADINELAARIMKAEQQLAEEKERKRPWSPEHTKAVIDGQVKEMDRQTEVIKALRSQLAERDARLSSIYQFGVDTLSGPD